MGTGRMDAAEALACLHAALRELDDAVAHYSDCKLHRDLERCRGLVSLLSMVILDAERRDAEVT